MPPTLHYSNQYAPYITLFLSTCPLHYIILINVPPTLHYSYQYAPLHYIIQCAPYITFINMPPRLHYSSICHTFLWDRGSGWWVDPWIEVVGGGWIPG